MCLSLALVSHGLAVSPSSQLPFNELSDSYYKVDPAAGTISVRVESSFYNTEKQPLASLPMWAMPLPQNVVVTLKGQDDSLKTELTPFSTAEGVPTLLNVMLPSPLKPSTRLDLVMTYTVGTQQNDFVHIEPGIVESLFVSQGRGSFALIDVPESAENYFDPGCLKASTQPGEVKSAGLERWICGEVPRSVLGRSQSTQASCANMEDKCRQRSSWLPFSAFAQSVTDQSLRGFAEADVKLSNKTVHVEFRYFRHDEAWAQRAFATAQAALPKLEQLFGYPYPSDTLSLRQSHHLEMLGAVGLAYLTGGDVLLTPFKPFDDEVVVHELAHQWAGGNLAESWEIEGLAQWAMRTLAPSMGYEQRTFKWQDTGYKDNLALWQGGSLITDGEYWYGKSEAFFFAYQQAIGGPEKMHEVLAKSGDTKSPLAPFDGRWFMDRGEEVSGANLDSLFLQWVFNPATAPATLAERRAAHDTVKPLRDRAAQLGFTGLPTDLQSNLDAWAFTGIANQVAQANAVLDSYLAVAKLSQDSNLPAPDAVARSWNTGSMARTQGVIDEQRQAIESITGAGIQLKNEAADSPALKQLAEARDKYAEGDFPGAKSLASNSTATAFNQVAAGKLIELAKAKRAAYHPSFFSRIGMLFSDPGGDLAAAEGAYASGDAEHALKLAKSAYNGWDDASTRGIWRLAILAAIMCSLSVGVWWLLHRLDRSPAIHRNGPGHYIDPADLQFGWKDLENPRSKGN